MAVSASSNHNPHPAKAGLALLAMLLLAPAGLAASVTGVCSGCHVMHASQGGSALTPRGKLLSSTCIGCHTGTNILGGATPYVLTAGKTDLSGALAGGNFKFSGDNASFGHNPLDLGVAAVVSAPGWKASGFAANGQVGGGVATWTTQLTCEGTWGCHGAHTSNGVLGGHHTNSSGQLNNATTVGNSFRFLNGIKGFEDSNWQFTSSTTDHNVYYGVARSGGEAAADTPTSTATMSYLCAECHGIFHSGASSSEGIAASGSTFFTNPWIRHPVDIAMPSGGAGQDFDTTTNTYQLAAPLASSTVPAAASSDTSAAANRIVMCLSCHQAHATPYYGILRWNYRGSAGSWTNGCAYCHTAKN